MSAAGMVAAVVWAFNAEPLTWWPLALLWLGLLFVLSIYFFPSGIVGKLRAGAHVKPGRSA